MTDYIFRVAGEPVGKGRPRFNTKTGRAYTPDKTARYENLVRISFENAYPGHDLITGAIDLTILAYFSIPQSWSKKKQKLALEEKIHKTSSPDADNITKAICDGLNKVAWKDDSQIVALKVYKEYSDTPRVDVIINALEEDEDDGSEQSDSDR